MKKAADAIERKNLVEAYVIYNEILEDDPNHLGALVGKGAVCFSMNDTVCMLVSFNKVLELDPYNETALGSLGDYYLNSGKYKKAGVYYWKLISIKREVSYFSGYADCLFYQKDYSQALAYMDTAISIEPENEVLWFNQGYYNLVMGDTLRACMSFNESVKFGLTEEYYVDFEHICK